MSEHCGVTFSTEPDYIDLGVLSRSGVMEAALHGIIRLSILPESL